MTACSIFASSSNVISVPSPPSSKLESTRKGTLYFPANSTERICSTLEPRLAISSISSKVTDLRRRACGEIRAHALLVDFPDPRLGVRAVGENADLSPGVAARLDAALEQRHAQ